MFYKIFILTIFFGFIKSYIVKPADLNAAPYDIWAHYHWVWLSNPKENQNAIIELVNDYKSYDIPVGAVNLDSAWPQNYQNFIWNEKYFQNASQLVDYLHSKDIKVISWITSTINVESSNFNEGKDKGYFLNNGKLIKWWRGNAALLDYSYPEAVDWWHKQMDIVLDIGIDGWKCDGTDPYVYELLVARGHKGPISYREYADYYYRDFFNYTREKRGPSALIMARPVDTLDEIVYLNYAPHDVMFSGWVGDQTGDWDGLKAALNNLIRSAWRGYLNFGCDIGGYRTDGSKLGRTKLVFTRWFQLGTFLPLMENGGEGEHRPWVFGNDTLDIYRVFANIHTNLAPFFLNSGTDCYSKNMSVLRPLASRIFVKQPSTFDYVINEMFYISPFTDNSTAKKLSFPGDSTYKWVYWFNNSVIFNGGDKIEVFECPYNEFPVFVVAGGIIPLQVDNHYTNLGTKYSKGFITLMITQPLFGMHTQKVHEFQSKGYIVEYNYDPNEELLEVFISAHLKNRFIILLTNVYALNATTQIGRENGEFEIVSHHEDERSFWPSEDSGTVFRTSSIYNQFFIKVSESAKDGVYLKIRNLRSL
jgi:alpha-glucosidase (family GH31 glycosyl hydrolase)